jgi:transglutaminase-like putative cysteine protease
MILGVVRTGLWLIPAVVLAVVGCSPGAVLPPVSSFAQGEADAARRMVDLDYRFTVEDIPAGAKQIAAWVPVPMSNCYQRLENVRVAGDWPQNVLSEPEYGNTFLHLELSRGLSQETREVDVTITFRVERREYRSLEAAEDLVPPSAEQLARFLAPDSLVPIDGRIAAEARRVASSAEDPTERARLLYDHIVDTLAYDKTGAGWGRGDALYACDSRKGNCTDFHSLFIAEARALRIPARFVMGLPLPPDESEGRVPGYHCWGEFYVADRGWVPIDASEANKHPEMRDFLFGALDENRVQFTIGRDVQIPGANVEALNYVIWPHVEVDGEQYTNVRIHLSYRNVDRR